MYPRNLTKEQLEEMSDEDVELCIQLYEKQCQIAAMRYKMLNFIEARDAQY